MNYFTDFVPTGNMGIHREIAEFLRKKIEAGVIAPGMQLPSQRLLAQQSHTNSFSIKLATDELVQAGVIAKQPGRGMFVIDSREKIRHVAIYSSDYSLQLSDYFFFSAFREILCRKLQEAKISYELIFDCRPEVEHTAPPEQLQRGIADGRVQLVIGTMLHSYDIAWFQKLPVRYTSWMFDSQLDFSRAREYLNGCSRIAAILPCHGNYAYSDILNQIKVTKIIIRPRRIAKISESEHLSCQFAKLGYVNALKLLSVIPRPDALIVYPDNAVPGVIAAIQELRIRVPEDLKVVFHRNLELSYFCPFEAFYLDVSITKMVQQTLTRVKLRR